MPRHHPKSQRWSEAERLRRLRELLGLSQRELAREFKVAHGAIGLWESGERTVPGPVLKLLELYEEEVGMHDQLETRPAIQALATSWFSRSLKLSKTTAGVTARFAASGLEKLLSDRDRSGTIAASTQAAVARQLVESLGEMKGFAMKVGQMMSYLDFAMPEPAREILATLQTSTAPLAPSVVASIIQEEFGQGPRTLFAEFSPAPFAAASIGQVHRARLHTGEEVAVKVQYPGIARTLDADLRNAAVLDRLGSVIFRAQQPGALIAELRERFLEECDYRCEARNQEEFRRLYADSPEIRIPRIFTELSGARVLTSEFVEGKSFAEFAAQATQAEKDRAGEILWRFAFESIFRHGIFNGDPHPGNYLFRDGQVVFLDFGCVKRFSPEFIARWRAFVRAVLGGDVATSERLVHEMGMVPDPARYDFDFHHRMMDALYEPWLQDRPYRFTPEFVARTWKMMAAGNPNKFRLCMPKDWVFTNRLQWGLYSILASLGATSNWRQAILDLVYDPGEPRPAPL